MTNKLTWAEYLKIKDIKILDLEICDYRHVNILNLGWEAWGRWYCKEHEREHVLCPSLCLPVSRNIIGCELVRRRNKRSEEPVKPNRPYDLARCYLCGKELKGASKKGVVKNRNNPSLWGVGSVYKILCSKCIGKRFYGRMVDWQTKRRNIQAQILSKKLTNLEHIWKVFYLNQKTKHKGYFLVNDYHREWTLANLDIGSVKNMVLVQGIKHNFLTRISPKTTLYNTTHKITQ